MDGILSDGRVGRLWMCKRHGGHALGLHIREKQNSGAWLDLLVEFRAAVEIDPAMDKVDLSNVMTSGTLEGTKRDIECTICDAKRTWYMGEAALERFSESRRRRIAPSAFGTSPILGQSQDGGGSAGV